MGDMRSSDNEVGQSWNATMVAEKVRAIVASKAGAPVTADSTFDSLGLDSLAMAEVIFEIETAFKIRADERLLNLNKISQVIDFVIQEMGESSRRR
jgi:acyl carrier protein